MPNVFSNSLDQLGQWLNSPDGQRAFTIQPNTPLTTSPDLVRPPAAQNPQGRTLFGMVARPITPGGQSGMAVSPSSVWNPNQPSPQQPPARGTTGSWNYTNPEPQPQASQYDLNYRMPSQTDSGAVPTGQLYSDRVPAAVPWEEQPTGRVTGDPGAPFAGQPTTMTPTGDVRGGGPTGTVQQPWGKPMGGPAPYTSPTNQAALAAQGRQAPGASPAPYTSPTNQAALNAANKVTHKIEGPTGSTTITHQAKTPGQGGQGGSTAAAGGGDQVGSTVYDLLTKGQGPSGPAPATGQPTGGQNVNLQVPAHPGLLQRIGQTIGHFFSGTLGQYQQPPGQYAGAPVQNQTGGSALSGISRALASGRQHVATHGRSSPASAPTPTLPYTATEGYSASAAMPRQGQPVPYVPTSTGAPPTGYVSGEGTAEGGPKPTPGFTFRGQDGKLYQADPNNPGQYVRIQ